MIDPEIVVGTLSARDLISLLDEAHPPRCIGPTESLEQAHRYAGARELIESLVTLLEQEDEEASLASRN